MASLQSVRTLIEENDSTVAKLALEVLCKLTNNVINNPNNAKYRRLRLGNAIVEEKLLPTVGAMECLFEIGFEEAGDYLLLPHSADLTQLKAFSEELQARLAILDGHSASRPSAGPAMAPPAATESAGPATAPPAATESASPAMAPPVATVSPRGNLPLSQPDGHSQTSFRSQYAFLQRLQSSAAHVLTYEQPALQRQALCCIPQQQLEERGLARLKEMGDQAGKLDLQDMVLLELLAWFKTEFFRWLDAPPCPACGGRTVASGMASPTTEELRWGAGRVEAYQCPQCRQSARFPRYNHPGKLLETRCGRCGEWANCFTLCCRALGFEARYVLDWTDHVWTEVYSQSQGSWLHCDPCENTCDKPLMYEAGWGKKLSYVIAFSKDDVQDVTWRYSSHHQQLLQRRTECSERWLVKMLMQMTSDRQAGLTASRRKVLLDRQLAELVELLTVRTPGGEEHSGRTSGSLAWRLARGETGSSPHTAAIITPTDDELAVGGIALRYCCATDQYHRGPQVVRGWAKLAHSVEGMQRKEEQDWKMAYLARQEGVVSASISWKLDLSGCGYVIEDLQVSVQSAVFENGRVVWQVCSPQQCMQITPDGSTKCLSDFQGEKMVTLSATLTGGKGDVAWQHTQLFRQSLQDTDTYPLSITVIVKRDWSGLTES